MAVHIREGLFTVLNSPCSSLGKCYSPCVVKRIPMADAWAYTLLAIMIIIWLTWLGSNAASSAYNPYEGGEIVPEPNNLLRSEEE